MAAIATGNREDALDIVQDAMTKLVTKYSGRSAEEWPPLFHRIMQTTIRDWYRRSKVRNGIRHLFSWQDEDAEDPVNNLADEHDVSPDRELGNQQGMDALETALKDLSLRQQQVFLLRAWEGMDVKQTAEAMGCSQGSVKTHYSRAIQTLREQLEGYEYES